jgi:hypothetical protein
MIVLGNPENRRVQLFARSFHALGGNGLEIVAWRDYLRDSSILSKHFVPGCSLRIDSPGEDFDVEKSLLARGAAAVEPHFHSLAADAVATLEFQKGRILPLRQWFLGWKRVLMDIHMELEGVSDCHVMNDPLEIATMFDKGECHEVLGAFGVPKPAFLGIPASHDELQALMASVSCRRVFLKPCHTSSASGIVALEASGNRIQAFSSVECARVAGNLTLFNSLGIRRYTSPPEITALVNAICRERSIAEAWFPKAGIAGARFDLRVLVIEGKKAHVAVRQSRGPITNLHLGNKRGDLDMLCKRMGEENWTAAMSVCAQAAAVFQRSLYVAVDLLVAPDFKRFAVAEVNAFGDLLPNLLYQGMDTYAAELNAWRRWRGVP